MTIFLFLYLIITKNTKYLFVSLEKQIFQHSLWILFLFCGGPKALVGAAN
jgi:hypothetical protein